ncbi:MAG TPA: hypothetical protein PK440_17955 [Candidatus Accumulibacter phosphatis]|nr:MAG: hypothetical protein AW07_02158 [Candidatus Accumulibacter sp. SK-11]HAY27704.1 hypothetical protein [Accumulibacter sp.]HRL78168.1 hypothetical protein [Candidatus Accumulibacter phosphatis]HCN66870.1 hypothetical protein [Accumulibacter sp.]HCV12626.1 hypothetical protein [Accumulibacter sp.]
MNSDKQISMDEILKELGVAAASSDGIHQFDIQDKFFIGQGCETTLLPEPLGEAPPADRATISRNISICCTK